MIPADALQITPQQFDTIELVLRVCETGSQIPKFGIVGITKDARVGGRIDIPQISYGVGQATQQSGALGMILDEYVARQGRHAGYFRPFVAPGVDTVEKDFALYRNEMFLSHLRAAGDDPVMGQVQLEFFRNTYFYPALRWAKAEGFKTALSALVICDSWLGSFGIKPWLRRRFPERPPSAGGAEEAWTKAYVRVRHDWLTNHENPLLRKSNYRTACYAGLIDAGNWDLKRPITIQGQTIL